MIWILLQYIYLQFDFFLLILEHNTQYIISNWRKQYILL
jgi:hypothetical protein